LALSLVVLICVATELKTSVVERNRKAAPKKSRRSSHMSSCQEAGITDKAKIDEYAQKRYEEWEEQQASKASESRSDKVDLENPVNGLLEKQRKKGLRDEFTASHFHGW
jgi:hypothetical protein